MKRFIYRLYAIEQPDGTTVLATEQPALAPGVRALTIRRSRPVTIPRGR